MKTPLTQTQLAIYYESVNKAGMPVYIIPVMLKLEPEVDLDRLRRAVDRVIERYPVLSMVLEKGEDGMPVLSDDSRLQKCDFRDLSDGEFEKERACLPRAFNLEGGKLFEAVIYKTPSQAYLYLPFHHVIADGSTFGVVTRAITDIYNGKELEPVPMSIFDVLEKENALRASSRFDEAKKWYNDTFGGIETDSTPLPDILEESAASDGSVLDCLKRKIVPLAVNYDEVFALSRQWKVPFSVMLDGAFGYMMGVWNAAEESVFTTIFAGRGTEEEKQVAGMMVKTLPVYCKWDKDTSVADYLAALAAQRKKAKEYADTYSFAEVCHDTGILPRLNFSYRGSIQAENTVIPGLCTGSSRLGYYTTGDSLQFMVDHIAGCLMLRMEYRGDRYTDAFMDSLADAYDMVLKGFVSKEKLSEIELCSAGMTSKLEAFNQTVENKETKGLTIVDLFRKHVVATPDKILLKNDDAELTYRQVGETADKLAGYISKAGIGKGDAVAVLVERNEWMLTATMGVLCSGAAYQPLDATYPAERLNYIMRDAGVRLLIADRSIDLKLEDDLKGKIRVLYTDEMAALPTGAPDVCKPAPEDTFILLYTSGTTGLPKGVSLTHANLMAIWEVNRRALPEVITSEDTWAVYASYGFDAGFYTLLMPVCAGASVSIVPEDVRLDMEGLNEFYRRHNVTFTIMTTQVGRIFATNIEETSLKGLMVGGEKLVPCTPPENFFFINAYGPTEGTVYCNAKTVDKMYTRVPIGRMNDDYKGYIVDRYGRRMPLGALGELLISGPQVGKGYLNLPEKTAAAFKPNPFCTKPPYDRLYCTGDIVRFLPESGEADIIGRNDGQVKIRGFRVELAEVEKVVREFPGITDATVQAFDSPAGGKFIAAYVVSDSPVDIAALNAFIAERKPPYMVPEVTMQIESIPLTQNQKVNKRALPEAKMGGTGGDARTPDAGEDTRTPNLLEKAICEILDEVLKLGNVPMSVPLPYLGLTSISSIRVASALYKRFGVNFKVADLIKGETVLTLEDKILEQLLSGHGAADFSGEAKAAAAKPVLESAPLAVSQQGVYADVMRNEGTTSYNVPVYFRFAPDTDAEALASAVAKILDAHPYLRDAHLVMGEEDVEQRTSPRQSANVPVKKMNEEETEEYRRHFIRAFNLMTAPLYRFEVVATPENVYLLMDVQHLVFDGSSLTVFLAQLKKLLEGEPIQTEPYSYLDYALTEKQWLEGEGGREAEQFFKKMLGDCEAASDIASDLPHSEEQGERGILTHTVDMPKVEKFCRENNLTPAALYLAAVGYATARFTTSRSAYISTISTGRSDVRFSDTFGMFVKTVPVALTLGEGSALDYVLQAKKTLADVVEHEMYPYAKICADYNYAPHIVYEYQYGLVDNYTINGKAVERRSFNVDTLKFKIAVHIEEIEGRPSVAVHYRKGLYSERLMQCFCDAIATVAESMMEAPKQPVRKISMLNPTQRELLEKLAVSALVQPSEKCFHELMEEQAALHPERAAVVACDRTLTYGELDRLSNIVANNLIAKGVKSGDKVVLLLSRTTRFFTSLYGVLKTGAAYIPSSPDYPEERKQSIIEDSEAAYVITDENVEELHEGDNVSKPKVKVTPDDLVYLIYTSGSTGKPKGVLLRHRGIVNYVTPHASTIHTQAIVEKCTVVGTITTVAFDMALKEWGIALSNGLTLVFADDAQSNDPVALASLFKANQVDYFNTTPSRMQQYMELDEFCDMLRGCKVVICGAEKYPEQLLGRLRETAPEAEIFNTYGPTEITVSSNACCLTHQDSVSVGRPLCNYVEHIVDADDNLLPAGVTGELLIGGENIAVGYNRNPEQTAKAFITFNGQPTYRSGDYARWDEQGNVVILGRKDTQVKLRGLRIELGEIERVIGAIEGVGASHIMIRQVAGKENLVAYYTLKAGVKLSAEDIKARMAEKLTDYMLPSFFVEMEQMPLTPNGKINTRALPEPAVAERQAGLSAGNDLEQFFIDVFKNILGTDTVYADDSFFAMGGTSLTATRIMIAASKASHRLVYADIFNHPTPQGLAKLIQGREGTAATTTAQSAQAAEPAPVQADIYASDDHYDYTAVNRLLSGNTLEAFQKGERHTLGTVLLTGATGYAGMHVLKELLTTYDVKIVCLGRNSRSGVSAAERIEQLYFYYFGEPMTENYPDRVTVLQGDITKFGKDFDPGVEIDTVINCAANVKHFSAGTDIEDINYYGVLNLIEWCKVHKARLVQTSTISVTGKQAASRSDVLSEQNLFIGQDFGGNKYVISKFMAERAVLQAHADGEIIGKVVRLGNLAPRERDGEFQANFRTNGFINRLKSMVLVGCYPYASYNQNKDISPIDDVARAIVLFAQTPDECVLFHGNNFNRYSLGNFYHEAARAGLDIKPVEADRYAEALEQAKNDPEKLGALVGLMAYEGGGEGLKPVDYTNRYSAQVLLRMGFHWPVVSSDYVNKLVRALDGLGFFNM